MRAKPTRNKKTDKAQTPPRSRYPVVDVIRGSAIALMFSYHFCFDLNYFGLTRFNFNYSPFWLSFRAVIVSLFLGTVGISLHLATRRGLNRRRYLQRLGLLLVFAGLISVVSYVMFPHSMIFFGILHFIALASILGLAFTRLHWLNLVLGTACLALGLWYQHPFFDQPAWQWFGLMTHKPITEDYVPVLPWFGVVLIGMFLGQTLFHGRDADAPAFVRWRAERALPRVLALGGRHSLIIYMLHQPVFMGVLYVTLTLTGHLR